jgi:hypothetical protein
MAFKLKREIIHRGGLIHVKQVLIDTNTGQPVNDLAYVEKAFQEGRGEGLRLKYNRDHIEELRNHGFPRYAEILRYEKGGEWAVIFGENEEEEDVEYEMETSVLKRLYLVD